MRSLDFFSPLQNPLVTCQEDVALVVTRRWRCERSKTDGRPGDGSSEWLVSGRTANELEKTPIARREALRAAYNAATRLKDDHLLKGFSNLDFGVRGYISNPLVADIPDERLYAELSELGVKVMDARHLTVAILHIVPGIRAEEIVIQIDSCHRDVRRHLLAIISTRKAARK